VRQILKQRELSQAIVFVNSKLGAARLARSFERDGLKTQALHGDKSQDERLKALAAFKAGEVDLLVATDVAARGLDIKDVPAVFNFDIPFNAEDYVHRIGRTGRAGASGLAVTFVTSGDGRNVADLEKLLKKKLDIEAFEFDDERPRGRINDGRRNWREHGVDEPREGLDMPRHASTRPERGDRAPAAPRTPADPFFSQPYEAPEATTTEAKPAWEAGAKPAANRISANIKPKRKLAALFASVPAEPAEPADSALAPEAPADQSAGS
jgi:superfamily II DNA/RNA helicase